MSTEREIIIKKTSAIGPSETLDLEQMFRRPFIVSEPLWSLEPLWSPGRPKRNKSKLKQQRRRNR